MALTLITNPVVGTKTLFAGFRPIEFVFKREDLAIIDVQSGTGGAKITHAGDLTSYLSVGDSVYLYSEGSGYTYDVSAEILEIAAGEITIDTPYIVTGTGGYINYLKNYYVEMQCVSDTLTEANLLPFTLQSDGDAAGNISIDVSVINDLNRQSGDIEQRFLTESSQRFEVKYREVSLGITNVFTLIDNKLIIALFATENPEAEVILNDFDMPKIYLGYPCGLNVAHKGTSPGVSIEMTYRELNNNFVNIASGTLGSLDSDNDGYLAWKWLSSATVLPTTKYIEFNFEYAGIFDFAAGDFDFPDFLTE